MITGSCLCDTVRYEVDELDAAPVHCHCRTCQKAHSAAFNTTARVRRDAFRWTRGDAARAAFESTPGKLRHFCPRCGSHLMSEWTALPFVILRIASVDEGDIPEPDAHIWTITRPVGTTATTNCRGSPSLARSEYPLRLKDPSCDTANSAPATSRSRRSPSAPG